MLVLASAVLLGGLAETSHAGLFGTDEAPGLPTSHICSLMRLLADLGIAPSYR